MKRIVQNIGILGGVVLVIALFGGLQSNNQRATAQSVETAQVQRTVLTSQVETTGSVAPETTVILSFGTSGIVQEVLVEVGDSVTAGAVLARLNTEDLENQIAVQEQNLLIKQANYDLLVAPPTAQELAQAQANLAAAQSQLEQAQTNLQTAQNNGTINCSSLTSAERILTDAQGAYQDYLNEGYEQDATFIPDSTAEVSETLLDAQSAYDVAKAQCDKTTPIAQYEVAQTAAEASVNQGQATLDALLSGATAEELASAKAQVTQAELQLADARAALADAVITASQTGIISQVKIINGQFATAGSTAIELVDNSQLHIDVTVDELDIPQVMVGQSVEITSEALQDTLNGTVTRIAPTADNTDGVVTYAVRVEIADAAQQPIRIGMTMDVAILVGDSTPVLAVPTAAIQRSGTTEFVQVQNADGSIIQVTIISGETRDGLTEISGDIEVGATVIIPSADSQAGGIQAPFGGN